MNGPNETEAHISYHMAVAGESDPLFSEDATALIHWSRPLRPAPLHLLSASATRSAAPYSTSFSAQPATAARAELAERSISPMKVRELRTSASQPERGRSYT